jgi:hypothetical protein
MSRSQKKMVGLKSAPASDANHLKGKRPGGVRRRAAWKSFLLASDFYEDDNQREEREGLDEHQT